MAFSFGNASTPNKPAGFGTPFGAAATPTANTSFGGFGSTFGATAAPQQPSTGFGSSFGAPNATAPPAFGSTFGAPTANAAPFGAPATAAPAFGVSFGTPASTSNTAFGTGFGSNTTGTGMFGAQAGAAKPSLFGAAASTPSLFSTPATNTGGFGLFTGAPNRTQAPTLFGGGTTTTTPGLFGGGINNSGTSNWLGSTGATTSTPGLFGSLNTATTTTTSLFGAPNTGFGGFGGNATTAAPTLFGGFGGNTTQSTSGFGFGSNTGFGTQSGGMLSLGGGAFGAKPAQPTATAAQTNQQYHQQVMASIYTINIFNDERDDILKKWNLLQACWGTGKGYYNASAPPVDYTMYNPFYRFKAVGYSFIPECDNADGIVKLVFNRKYAELSTQQQVIINGITGILGNKPNLKVTIQQIKAMSDTQSEMRVVVTEKGVTGSNRKIPATDLAAFLNQPAQKQQLSTVGVSSVVAYVTPTKGALEEYLRTVPAGFDPQMWTAAVADNPNSSKYMPVPIYGFNDLKARKLKQEHETGLHRAYEEKIHQELEELKKKHVASIAKINEMKHRFLRLQHKTLKILVRQECIRKTGIALQPEEEYLKGKLESMYSHLNVPTQFKGQLNELISTVKLMENSTKPTQPRYKLVAESQGELKEFLQLQQNGISKLVDIVKDDMRSLNIITDGMRQILPNTNHV